MPDLRSKPTKSSRHEVNWEQKFQHIHNEGLTPLQKFTPAFNPKGEAVLKFRVGIYQSESSEVHEAAWYPDKSFNWFTVIRLV